MSSISPGYISASRGRSSSTKGPAFADNSGAVSGFLRRPPLKRAVVKCRCSALLYATFYLARVCVDRARCVARLFPWPADKVFRSALTMGQKAHGAADKESVIASRASCVSPAFVPPTPAAHQSGAARFSLSSGERPESRESARSHARAIKNARVNCLLRDCCVVFVRV